MLEESQVLHNNKVYDFNTDGGEFSQAEMENRDKFLADPGTAMIENLAIEVRDASKDDIRASYSQQDGDFYYRFLDNMYKTEQPKREDYNLDDPTDLQRFTVDMQEFNNKQNHIKTVIEMFQKITGDWLKAAKEGVNNSAF